MNMYFIRIDFFGLALSFGDSTNGDYNLKWHKIIVIILFVIRLKMVFNISRNGLGYLSIVCSFAVLKTISLDYIKP